MQMVFVDNIMRILIQTCSNAVVSLYLPPFHSPYVCVSIQAVIIYHIHTRSYCQWLIINSVVCCCFFDFGLCNQGNTMRVCVHYPIRTRIYVATNFVSFCVSLNMSNFAAEEITVVAFVVVFSSSYFVYVT